MPPWKFIPTFDWVYCSHKGITNIISIGFEKEQGFKVYYNTNNGGCFEVYNPRSVKTTYFCKSGNLSYTCDISVKQKEQGD